MLPTSFRRSARSGLFVPERFEAADEPPLSPALRAHLGARAEMPSGTAVSGDPVVTHATSAGEIQVVIPAHASGHMRGTIPTYSYWRPFAAGAANQRIIDIFNATGSGVDVKLRKLFLHHNQSVQTGVPVLFDAIHTTSVGTGGTVITGRLQDSAEPAVPANVTCRSSATGGATESYVRFGFAVDTEETRPATSLAPMINWLAEGEDVGDVVLHEGQGFLVKQITSTTVGIWGCWLIVSIIPA